jgi:hypothetical protein
VVIPRKLPNSRELTPPRKPLYRATNRKPQASRNAWTVPVSADSWPLPPCLARGMAAITRAPPTQNAK